MSGPTQHQPKGQSNKPGANPAAAPAPEVPVAEQIQVRLDKLSRIRERGENPYKNGLEPKDLAHTLHLTHDGATKEDLEAKKITASVAGRMLMIRDFGKACFVRLQDRSGIIQLYVQKDSLGDAVYAGFKEWDIGDIVFAEGHLFKTKTGELSIHCNVIALMTKSLRPLPEKFHGITDVEMRYRQRYVDLMVTPETRETFKKRSLIVEEVRKFFVERDFIEVETPMMHPVAGGATARPFVTHHNTLDMELFLRIAPELYLKRLLVGGLDRVFEINRNFRNEGISIKHNPEFTMLEFYQAYATFEDLMTLTEELYQRVAQKVSGGLEIEYQGRKISFASPWRRLRVEDAIIEYSGFKNREDLRDGRALWAYGKSKGHPMSDKMSVGEMIMVIFDEEVEKSLVQPTFITHYPLDVSPLSRKNEKDPFLVDRFEFYVNGWELANAFSELNDPQDQRDRFLQQMEAKEAGNEEACGMDEDYITALEYGMPPAAGQGIGIDRMAMLFTNSASIRDVILFPLMRPRE